MTAPLERLLTPAEVADAFAIPEQLLRTWRWKGVGPEYLKLGPKVRYRAADVAAYLERQTVTPRNEQPPVRRLGRAS